MRWVLRLVWLWFAIGVAGVAITRGPALVTGLRLGDPEAIGGIAGLVLMSAALYWSRTRVWRGDAT